MLAEKLLLNLLITISPVLLFSVLIDNRKKLKSPIIHGIFYSIAALSCMIFSYGNYGFNWDLRYVPMILAYLYTGPVAGTMVFTTIFCSRILLGGETILFGLVNTVLIVILPVLLYKKFWIHPPNKRVIIATLIGACSLLLIFFSFTIYQSIKGQAEFKYS